MKIISFNINGIRARLHQLQHLAQQDADIIGLQEIKVQDTQFPHEPVQAMGYQACVYGQKGYHGVATLCRQMPCAQQRGFACEPQQTDRRMLLTQHRLGNQPLYLINGYFPQGENRNHPSKFPAKRQFYAQLLALLQQRFTCHDAVIVLGDFNVAPQDHDIGIAPHNQKRWLQTGKCAFLPEERQWYQALQHWGLQDTFRHQYPQIDDRFSWFDYRSKGFDDEPKRGLRIDHILATPCLIERLLQVDIDYPARAMDKPSDHAPIWAQFEA